MKFREPESYRRAIPLETEITDTLRLEVESKMLGTHYDETTFKAQSQGKEISDGNYCWVKIGVETQNQLIWFGKGRGKQVGELMRGEKEGSIGISDDYGFYKHLFDHHQLCWAHPSRKLRDLAESGKLEGRTKQACQKTFKEFQALYKKPKNGKSWNPSLRPLPNQPNPIRKS